MLELTFSPYWRCLWKSNLSKHGLREFLPGLLLWLHRMVEIVLSYGNLMSFLIVTRICGDIFLSWPYSVSVYFRISCLSEQFPRTRSLGNFHFHTFWEADFCVCWVTPRRMEIYLCVHYFRRLFSEYHLHVRCHFSLEHRIFLFVFKTKNQRIPLFCS